MEAAGVSVREVVGEGMRRRREERRGVATAIFGGNGEMGGVGGRGRRGVS